ncbi:MAG: hypothetical protein U5K00_23905 [Melioribacteraceae bacterium]|nr:hypothetical protein [Melioribacteraceae bacterium]
MKKNIIFKSLFVFSLLIIFAACSEDDSNPSNPQTPETAGTYQGTNSLDTTMTITVSGISGKAFVTSYSINYKSNSGGTSIKGNVGESDSDGLAEVVNNSFEISLGAEADEKLTGTISSSTMTGNFKIPSGAFSSAITGTYSISK